MLSCYDYNYFEWRIGEIPQRFGNISIDILVKLFMVLPLGSVPRALYRPGLVDSYRDSDPLEQYRSKEFGNVSSLFSSIYYS